MANVTQLKHLEHLEDEMLNYGVEGCVASVNFLKELMKMLGKKSDASGFLQTKWDGAPSVICGKSPCLLYTSPSPRDVEESRMPSSA